MYTIEFNDRWAPVDYDDVNNIQLYSLVATNSFYKLSPIKHLMGEIYYIYENGNMIYERVERISIKHNNINVSL